MARNLSTIAEETIKDMIAQSPNVPWQQKFATAKPYVMAMRSLSTLDDFYGLDKGKGIVLYFLANAGTWRGEVARRIKAELNAMLKEYG